jgi:hypothetical protein
LKITIESEAPDDPRALFLVILNGQLVGERLTAAQAQLVVAEIIERFVLGEGSAIRSRKAK